MVALPLAGGPAPSSLPTALCSRFPNCTAFRPPLDPARALPAISPRAGAAIGEVKQRLLRLGAAVELPQNDPDKHALYGTQDPTEPFLRLLARARLHRHLPGARPKRRVGWAYCRPSV